ncbi:MAG: AmmeMemoRadiSam system radical SAM enzyme [Bacteroidales bacterium]
MMDKEAAYYQQVGDKVQCLLCPHECILSNGQAGICNVRYTRNNTLYTRVYNRLASVHMDPIEKKPLYHFYPGSQVLSVGTVGCNMQCAFCQNWEISQFDGNGIAGATFEVSAEALVDRALKSRCLGVAYTYNEPTVFYEFMLEIARQVKAAGLKNVMVTNGYINPEPLTSLFPYIDAFSVDLKGFTEAFYRQETKASLAPVLETVAKIRKAGKHLELVNLIVPNQNDHEESFLEMMHWIREHLGKRTVLHLSRYFPAFRMEDDPTPLSVMHHFHEVAKTYLDFVYLGNMREAADTFCPVCGALLLSRSQFQVLARNISPDGHCEKCNEPIIENYIP